MTTNSHTLTAAKKIIEKLNELKTTLDEEYDLSEKDIRKKVKALQGSLNTNVFGG